MKQRTKDKLALLDLLKQYKQQVLGSKVDFYDRNEMLRTGIVTDVKLVHNNVRFNVQTTSKHLVNIDSIRL